MTYVTGNPNIDKIAESSDTVDAEPADESNTGALAAVLRLGFVITLAMFLIGGFVLVIAQAVDLVLGDGVAAADLGGKIGPPTFITATICGMLAFAQEYLGAHLRGEDA